MRTLKHLYFFDTVLFFSVSTPVVPLPKKFTNHPIQKKKKQPKQQKIKRTKTHLFLGTITLITSKTKKSWL